MKNKQTGKIVGLIILVFFIGIVAYFFISSESSKPGEIPSYVTGDLRAVYEWAKTSEGVALLEKIPCYCGCKYEGHRHSRDCFWRDDGTFDKHGITCSVCLDIAKKAREMHEQGKGVCEIRKEIDAFYAPNAELGTDTPMPEECR